MYIVTAILLAWFLDNDTRVPRPLLAFTGCFALIGIYVGMIVCKSKPGLYVLIIVSERLKYSATFVCMIQSKLTLL